MDQYFHRIKKLSENDQLPSRVRFRLLDIIDMRQREWRQRRQVAGPRPVSEIRAEFGSDLDPSLMSLSGLTSPSSIEEKPKTPKPSQCDFFAPRQQPAQAMMTPPDGAMNQGDSGSLSRITKAFVSSVEKTKNEKYQPPRRSAQHNTPPPPTMESPIKKEKSVEAKKAFMPSFIKQTNQNSPSQAPMNAQRFTSLGGPHGHRGHAPRSGLPGPPSQPSPFDRINKDRQMHQNKTRQNHQRRESPTHSPSRDFGKRNYENGYSSGGSDNHRLSPHRRSPSFDNNHRNRNGFGTGNGFGRNSPTMQRQSPLAQNGNRAESPRQMNRPQIQTKINGNKTPDIDPNKGNELLFVL